MMLENRKQVIQDWEFLTRRKLNDEDLEKFVQKKEFGILAVRTQEERIKAGELAKEPTKDYFVYNLKLDKWLKKIYDLSDFSQPSSSENVWISPGSKSFHENRECKWFIKGKEYQANHYSRAEYKDQFISRIEAENHYQLKPCKYCTKRNRRP